MLYIAVGWIVLVLLVLGVFRLVARVDRDLDRAQEARDAAKPAEASPEEPPTDLTH